MDTKNQQDKDYPTDLNCDEWAVHHFMQADYQEKK